MTSSPRSGRPWRRSTGIRIRRPSGQRLPRERLIELPGVTLGVVHDAGPSRGRLERLRARFPDAGAVVFGHSHLPLHESRDGFQIFNPGSPTERRRAPRHSMGMARVERGTIAFEHVWLS